VVARQRPEYVFVEKRPELAWMDQSAQLEKVFEDERFTNTAYTEAEHSCAQ
jgi:hypothetical protein